MKLSRDFSESEFACPCCGQVKMHPGTIARLQALRDAYGKPIPVVEGGGYRCIAYDGKPGSHTEGRAVDPGIPREDLHQVVGLAIQLGFTGVGVKQRAGRWQLHIDDAEPATGRPRPALWTYE